MQCLDISLPQAGKLGIDRCTETSANSQCHQLLQPYFDLGGWHLLKSLTTNLQAEATQVRKYVQHKRKPPQTYQILESIGDYWCVVYIRVDIIGHS
jgi:hypothetical protein